MAGFLGAGDLLIDRDLQGGFLYVGNATQFAINETEADVKERISKMRDTYGQALDTVTLAKPPKITITIDEFDVENLAIALRGIVEVLNQASGSVTNQEYTAKADKWIELGKRKVSSVVVKSQDETTTYNEGEDYVVNTRLGLLKVLSSGAISDGATIKVSFSYEAVTGKRVLASRQAEIECALLLDGMNKVNGRDCTVRVYKAKLRPSAEVDFLADDFQSLTLEGTLVTPEGKTEPYVVEYLD